MSEAKLKPARQPLYAVGARVTTKHTVPVPKRVLRRRWLFLLPGTEWTVTAVEADGKRTPVYTLTAGEHEITRQEWRLRAIGEQKRKAI